MIAIYGILNKINGHKYVGSAKNFYKRKALHLRQLHKNDHHSYYLQAAWNKYGEENFEFLILEKLEKVTDLIPREQWWIDNSNSEYNICKIAGNSLGVKRSEETKRKLSESHIGLKQSEETKKKRADKLKGIKRSKELKQQWSESKKGKNNPMYGKQSPRKGKTYEEIYGPEKAKEMREKLRSKKY